MCGIAGIVRAAGEARVDEDALLRMARAIRHRGPDGFGLALDDGAGFVATRLAIVDLPCGWQPIEDEADGDLLVYNGEVYNHIELREELRAQGVSFDTSSDTEVVLRLLERDGLDALRLFNGQFAFAWWQARSRKLTLVRDRFGVRPLHFALRDDGTLVFGSEVKALFASGEVEARPDLGGIDDVFTTWGARPPRSPFRGVDQLAPGGFLVWEDGKIVARKRWWEPEYGDATAPDGDLLELMRDSVDLRLRADVPVGAYLSGGLDSSLISALAQQRKDGELRTFSIAFKDPLYDERAQQEAVARALRTQHHVVEAGPGEIAAALPDVIRHTETPLIRTAPVPLFLLARAVRENDLTVVITGEGADELFWGYDLFKEVAIRELHRVVKVGVYFGGITSDMTREVIEEHDLLYEVQTVMTLWQWSELFLKNGFRLASVSPQSLERVWRIETKANEGDFPWYTGADAMRFCFYTKIRQDEEAELHVRRAAGRF